MGALRGRGSPYGVSKAGILRLTSGLARDLASNNIRVNCIAPGWVITDVGVVVTEEEHAAFNDPEMLKGIPLGRAGQPEDISGVALFLASETSNYVTGQTIIVDGGTST